MLLRVKKVFFSEANNFEGIRYAPVPVQNWGLGTQSDWVPQLTGIQSDWVSQLTGTGAYLEGINSHHLTFFTERNIFKCQNVSFFVTCLRGRLFFALSSLIEIFC